VIRSVFGVIIIAILGRGLIQLGAEDPTKQLITGCVIVAAVIMDHYRRHSFRRARPPAENPSPRP
jgi:ribose transport system permease protein